MSYMFVSFVSRTVTLRAYNHLVDNGVSCSIISTPTQANVGCGISVGFEENAYDSVLSLLGYSHPALAGYFRVTRLGNKRIVIRV
ncbi:MAG: DUF3343 domain-containing protein [Clostridia bacterium]|nr:DUF3343 domain-containing protein [Clostridia bacterium]